MATETFNNHIDYFYEPTRGGASSLWHVEPLVKLGRRAQGSNGASVFTNRNLVQRRDGVEEEENAFFFVERVNKSSRRGIGGFPKYLM